MPNSTLCRRAAGALSDKPIKLLESIGRRARVTALFWCNGRLRPPVNLLQSLATLAVARGLTELATELATEIDRRQALPPKRGGALVVRERDGLGTPPRDGRRRGKRKRPGN